MDRLGAQEGEVLTHPLITRSIEGAQKRVELQNFQARKRLLDYDDVMNQQREVIYSLRSFALEGGEELKGEAVKMIDKAITNRVETSLAEYDDATQWDFDLLRQDLLMHYLLQVPEYDKPDHRPTEEGAARDVAVEAAKKAFWAKLQSLDSVKRLGPAVRRPPVVARHAQRAGREVEATTSTISDQLRNLDPLPVVGGRSDPLIEYKQEAYTMFVDLMKSDILQHAFSERFLKVQLVFEPPAPPPPPQQQKATRSGMQRDGDSRGRAAGRADRHGRGGGHRTVRAARVQAARAQGSDDRRCGTSENAHQRRRRAGRSGGLGERRAERPVSLRVREEVQEVSRSEPLATIGNGSMLGREAAAHTFLVSPGGCGCLIRTPEDP